jgi:hypothetical protein
LLISFAIIDLYIKMSARDYIPPENVERGDHMSSGAFGCVYEGRVRLNEGWKEVRLSVVLGMSQICEHDEEEDLWSPCGVPAFHHVPQVALKQLAPQLDRNETERKLFMEELQSTLETSR